MDATLTGGTYAKYKLVKKMVDIKKTDYWAQNTVIQQNLIDLRDAISDLITKFSAIKTIPNDWDNIKNVRGQYGKW